MLIVFISCSKTKIKTTKKIEAEKIYNSLLFKKKLLYAKKMKADKIFILSAKYGLLFLHNKILPYDLTLKRMTFEDHVEWSKYVINQIKQKTNPKKDKFIILASSKYYEHILPYLKNYELPLKGLYIGEQLKWLNKKILIN